MKCFEESRWKICLNSTYAIITSPRGRWRFVIAKDERVILPPVIPISVANTLHFYGFKVKRRCRKSEKGYEELFEVCRV